MARTWRVLKMRWLAASLTLTFAVVELFSHRRESIDARLMAPVFMPDKELMGGNSIHIRIWDLGESTLIREFVYANTKMNTFILIVIPD